MVSTRGPKYKFSQGERVLCYEPDPTKAKVLYDSKVLEVIEQKGKRGRRTVQYLIHFKGWNSSWDRCVGEELVLKDTEHNRQLQRTLAEKAQLQIGTYLYRKERKKGGSASSATGTTVQTGKRPRVSDFEDEDLNTFSSQEEGDVEEEQSEDVSQANSRSSTGGNSSSCEESDSSSEYHSDEYGPASIHIGPMLRDRLSQDYELIVCEGRLLRLPCRPNALQLLEGCVKHHTTKTIAAHTPPPPQADVQEQARRLNILREVADGLRVYLDFILRDQLLYESEKLQYQQAVIDGLIRDTQPTNIKQEDEGGTNKVYPEDYAHLPPSPKVNPSGLIKIKTEPCSPPKVASDGEVGLRVSPINNVNSNNEREAAPEWQNVRIKNEDNNCIVKKDNPNSSSNDITDRNSLRRKSVEESSRCREDRKKAKESPPHRYNMRENRSSFNVEAGTEFQNNINDNNSQYKSEYEGGQLEIRNSDERISNNNVTENQHGHQAVNNQDAGSKSNHNNNNSNANPERISLESGRVLRGCVKKVEKTENNKGEVRDNGSNCSNNANVSRKRRAKRPRLSARRLRSHRPRSRTTNPTPLLPPPLIPTPFPVPAAIPTPNDVQPEIAINSQPEIPNSKPTSQPDDTPASVEYSKPGPSKINLNQPAVPTPEVNGGVNDEFKGALEWRIVPPEYPPYPTAVYGAVHLARLFVKLPEYLSVINMPESKLELIVEFIEYFVKYLEEHSEWFGESFYYIPETHNS